MECWWRPRHGNQADKPERPYYWSGPSDPGRATELGPHTATFSSQSAAEAELAHSAARPPSGSRWEVVTVEVAESRNDPYPRRVGWARGEARRVSPPEAQP